MIHSKLLIYACEFDVTAAFQTCSFNRLLIISPDRRVFPVPRPLYGKGVWIAARCEKRRVLNWIVHTLSEFGYPLGVLLLILHDDMLVDE